MNKRDFKKFNNKYESVDAFRFFFFLVVSVMAVSLLYNVVLNIVAVSMGTDFNTLYATESVQVITNCLSPVTLIVYFIVYNSVRKISFKEAFSDGQKISLLPISIAIVLAIIAIFLFTPFMNLIDYLFSLSGYNPSSEIPLTEKMASSGGYFLLGLFVYALLPAISEEIVFRGVIQRSLLSKYSGFVAIFMSSILFVLMHGSLQQTVYQLVMAILLGYLACVGGSILYSIILHFLNNALVLVFGCFDIVPYLSAENTQYYNIFSMIFPVCIFLLGVALVGILFWVLKYLRNKNFFREDSSTKHSPKSSDSSAQAEKIGLLSMWKNTTYLEKVFLIISLVMVGALWLINTINGFVS